MELWKYNFTIEHRSEKKNQNANTLSRLISKAYIKKENLSDSELFKLSNHNIESREIPREI